MTGPHPELERTLLALVNEQRDVLELDDSNLHSEGLGLFVNHHLELLIDFLSARQEFVE